MGTTMAETTPDTLCHYQTIVDITEHMLAYARAAQWDQVTALAREYRQAVQNLHNAPPLSHEELASRRELMLTILENDASLRRLITPELERIGRTVGNLHRQRNVLQAYFAPVG